jgi:hypothetical protein
MVQKVNSWQIVMGKKIKWISFTVTVLIFAIFILATPLNKYVWMLNTDPEMTRATLPDDSNAGMYPFFAGTPSLFLLFFLFFFKTKKERIVFFSVFISLFVMWLIRFWPTLVVGPPY